MTDCWKAKTSDSEAARRAGGRRRYNLLRQRLAEERLEQVLDIMDHNGWSGQEWGFRAKIARELGVSRATIARDLQHLKRMRGGHPTYAEEWLRFFRYHRRVYGECFGPHPGAMFPQMDHSAKRTLRVALGLAKPYASSPPRMLREAMEHSCEPDEPTSQDPAPLPDQASAPQEGMAGSECQSVVLDDPRLAGAAEPPIWMPDPRNRSSAMSNPAE